VLTACSALSCNKDGGNRQPVCEDGSTPTYNSEMKDFIDSNCTQSGCHASGSVNGDYTDYFTLSIDLENGKITDRVLDKQDMPKAGRLTQDELNLFQCWADNNYAEE